MVLLCLELQLLGVTTYLAKSEKWEMQRALGIKECYVRVERKSRMVWHFHSLEKCLKVLVWWKLESSHSGFFAEPPYWLRSFFSAKNLSSSWFVARLLVSRVRSTRVIFDIYSCISCLAVLWFCEELRVFLSVLTLIFHVLSTVWWLARGNEIDAPVYQI